MTPRTQAPDRAAPALSARLAAPADGEDVLALLAPWHGEDRARRRRAWLERNPHGAPLTWIARSPSGEAVGTTALFPRRFVVDGREALGCNGGDAWVAPAMRRGGVARLLHEATRDAMRPDGLAFMFGPPLQGNLGPLVHAGARIVGTLRYYWRPLTGRGAAIRLADRGHGAKAEALLAAAGTALAVEGALATRRAPVLERATEVGPEFDRLWEAARRWHRVAGVRDAAWVRWRFLEAPVPTEVWVLRRAARLAGYVATHRDAASGRMVLLDCLAASPGDLNGLVSGTLRLARSLGCLEVGTRLNPRTAYAGALRRFGFLQGHTRPAVQVLSPAPPPGLLASGGWHLTHADEDGDDPAWILAPAAAEQDLRRAKRAETRGGGPAGGRAKRVLFLMDIYSGAYGGTERQIHMLLSALPRRWRADLWILHRSGFLATNPFPCPSRSWGIASLRRPETVLRLLRLAGTIRAEGFDLVVAFQGDASVVGPALGALAGVPVLCARRDLGFWHTPAILAALRRVDRLAVGFVANCEAVRAHVARDEHVPRAMVEVVENGHPLSRFDRRPDPEIRRRLGIPEGAPIVGLLANLRALKRHEDLVEALACLAPRSPALPARVLGRGYATARGARAARRGVADRFHVVGSESGRVVSILQHWTAGVLCSDSEGLSNAVIEYLGCGLPVVATDVGGNPDLVTTGENGFLYPVGDVPALAEALARLLSDRALAASMGAASRRRFERDHVLERMVDETVAGWDRAVAPPAAPVALSWSDVSDLDALEALAPAWRALTGPGRFFTGPDWTIEWLRRMGSGAPPPARGARDAAGALAGVLPLARVGRGVLTVCGARAGADHVDVVAAPGLEGAVAAGALDRLAEGGWRRVRLPHLAEDGALRLEVRRRRFALPYGERLATTCPYVDASGSTWDEYLARRFSRHRRHEVRRMVRRALEGDGTPGSACSVDRVVDPAACEGAVRRLFDLHERRFLGAGRATAFSGERLRAFHAALARRLAESGSLFLLFLRRGGRDLAAYYGFRSAGRVHHFQSGIDPEAEGSPGTVLRAVALERDVFGAGLTEFDFLDGDEAYKFHWATGVRRLFDVDVYPPTRVGRGVALAMGAARLARNVVRARWRRARG